MKLLKNILFVSNLILHNFTLYGKSLSVQGWIFPNIDTKKEVPPIWLGDEPFFGRLSCPGIIRLNTKEEKNESIFFSSILTEKDGLIWKYELKPGFFWWDETPVTPQDIKDFFDQNLKTFVNEKSRKLWTLPEFTSTAEKQMVILSWKEKPTFGPYIFNGISLFKKKENYPTQYMCAGLYKLKTLKTLTYNRKYDIKRVEEISFEEKKQSDQNLIFSWAKNLELSKQKNQCLHTISIPWISGIIWKNIPKKLRIELTQILPRGAFLKNGASDLGTLLSAPIPRWHPGYDEKILVRSHSQFISNEFKGKTLKLFSIFYKSGLVEKLVHDIFISHGLKVEWISNEQEADGIFKSFYIPIPQIDYLPFIPNEWINEDPELKKILTTYSLSLTQEYPDLKMLKKIHEKMYHLENMTIFFQHKTCINNPLFHNYNEKDSDFFKKII